MKHLSIFCLALLIITSSNALDPEFAAKFKQQVQLIGEMCAKETGLPEGGVFPIFLKTAPITKEEKCFLFCMHKAVGFQDVDGKIMKSSVCAWVDSFKSVDADYSAKLLSVAIQCVETDDSCDPCDAAGAMFVCYTEGTNAIRTAMPFE